MKVKFKVTVEQFSFILRFVYSSTYTDITELQILNIRIFKSFAMKKLIDWEKDFYLKKPKTISIDINQYTAVMALLMKEQNNLDPLMLSIFISLQNQNRPLLNLL